MSDHSAIEWTDASWNPIRARRRDTGKIGWHCEHVSEGCRNCYAETFNGRGLPNGGTGLAYKPGHRDDVEIFLDEKMLLQPLHWRRPRMIFVGSMTDLFADFVTAAMLDRIFAVMALCPQHTFQVLTKRPERMRAYMANEPLDSRPRGSRVLRIGEAARKIAYDTGHEQTEWPWPLPGVWLGTSCEDQPTADARVPALLATPAAIRFVSAEPLLGQIDFREYLLGFAAGDPAACLCGHGHGFTRCPNYGRVSQRCHRCSCASFRKSPGAGLHQIIVGGESGPRARPMHPEWVRSIRDQCAAAGVAFFFKQHGEFRPLGPIHGPDRLTIPLGDADERRSIILCSDGARWPDEDGQPPPDAWMLERVGKKAAGRLLDGIEHNGMPPLPAGGPDR